MQYIDHLHDDGCVFCAMRDPEGDEERCLLHRREHAFVVLNAFPYNNGHLLVAPYRHVAAFEDLTPEEVLDLMAGVRVGIQVLRAAFHPDGFNFGANLGRVAGAGIADHLHLHVVPRWNGDTNFMPVIGETKVLPEAIRQTFCKLQEALRGLEIA
jgi:ATP adenylyltransferase